MIEFSGVGGFVEFVESWMEVFRALDETRVIQPDYLGSKASLRYEEGQITLQF